MSSLLAKRIVFFGKPATVGCDAQCNKAWGREDRPKRYLGGDPEAPGLSEVERGRRFDDYEFLADKELPEAPVASSTMEGDIAKPRTPEDRLNRWCVRSCERCQITLPGEQDGLLELPTFDAPRPNRRRKPS